MKRSIPLFALTTTILLSAASWANAQNYGQMYSSMHRPTPTRQPTVSPYLNLLQFQDASDESIPVYQTLVRPFVDQRRLNQHQVNQVYQLQQQVARNAVQSGGTDRLRQTGHTTIYGNHSHYFPNLYGRR
ncbi:MAG: hypothetical protein SGJ19_03475 [Planctomycetia bacterium]|nr:hypothetical protein [Planctomycetia bacterium]